MFTTPTSSEFKAFFARDFQYAPAHDANNLSFITDTDINRAVTDGLVNFNDGLFGDDANHVFFYLAAYWLVENIKASQKGLGAQAIFPINNTSVGSVSVGYQIPERFARDPQIAMYARNAYGLKYLSLALPYAVGNVGLAVGTTTVG